MDEASEDDDDLGGGPLNDDSVVQNIANSVDQGYLFKQRGNFQTAEKSRGWLGFWWFSDQMNRVNANYFLKNLQKNEKTNEWTKKTNEPTKNRVVQVVTIAGRVSGFGDMPTL